jgi:hypothetical protein
MWEIPDVSRFGIDIFESFTALAKGYEIKQAYLGVKEHDPKDPSSQLTSMFRQVMNTMFTCIERYESSWKEIEGFTPTEMVGSKSTDFIPEPVKVSLPATIEAFRTNFDAYSGICKRCLSSEILETYELLKNIDTQDVEFPPEVWAETVYSFIAEFHRTQLVDRENLIDALRVLWIGRVAAFLKETWEETREESEDRIVKEAKVFREQKHLLLEKYSATSQMEKNQKTPQLNQ